jgi:phosphoribosylanthranilate isomerase
VDSPRRDHGYGGTGKSWDYDAVIPLPRKHLFVSGGLNPQNVGDVMHKLRPFALDVSSGIESSPGVKDFSKMNDFIKSIIIANEQIQESLELQA